MANPCNGFRGGLCTVVALSCWSLAQSSEACLQEAWYLEDADENVQLLQISAIEARRSSKAKAAQQRDLLTSRSQGQQSPSNQKGVVQVWLKHLRKEALKEEEEVPTGSDIWNETLTWAKVSELHPAGVISRLGGKQSLPTWNQAAYINLDVVMVLCAVAYPAFLVFALLVFTVLVSMCLSVDEQETPTPSTPSAAVEKPDEGGTGHAQGESEDQQKVWEDSPVSHVAEGERSDIPELPVLPKHRLTPTSQRIYACWAFACCAVPSMMVFGTPGIMVGLARPYPQEVLAALTLLTSAFIFSNGIYMLVFGGRGVMEMCQSKSVDFSRLLEADEKEVVEHWVILPQYKEDMDVVTMALRSIAASSIAKSSIGIVLALETREEGASDKAEELMQRVEGQFKEVIATYHPADLPNDPPGKASNLSWAFKELVKHVGSEGRMAKAVLTVADADSEFSRGYFEGLSSNFLEAEGSRRYTQIWQSPVFHVKNYHRQPSPVIVGTLFTSMQEIASLSDPNAVRFPYSSYSLSMNLARRVGGWDAEWIAEDYHMGIKCFLMTLGETTVEPVMLPTVNYVPEVLGSWWGTCMARWTQAKRHALGFSDFSYYFMMLPLVFSYSTCRASKEGSISSLYGFWKMLSYGSSLIVRLMNVHVLIGVLSTYGVMEAGLKLVMKVLFNKDRHVEFLILKMGMFPSALMTASVLCTLGASMLFVKAYGFLQPRIEGSPQFKNAFLHWAKNSVSMAVCAPVYFVMLSFAIWRAAIDVLTQSSFEYEVAPKPVLAEACKEKVAGGGSPAGKADK